MKNHLVKTLLCFVLLFSMIIIMSLPTIAYQNINWTYFFWSSDNGGIVPVYISQKYNFDIGGSHKGFDITTGVSGDIEGFYCRNVTSGTVLYKGLLTGGGNTIVVRTTTTDPVSGNQFTLRYMHFANTTFCPTAVNNTIYNGTYVGEVSNTGLGTPGENYHLHFDVNTGLTYDGKSMTPANTIKPNSFFTWNTTFTGQTS